MSALTIFLLLTVQVLAGCDHHRTPLQDAGAAPVLDGALTPDASLVPDASPPACGDNKRQASEQCDGADLGNQTCVGLGGHGGKLACTSKCTVDVSGCTWVSISQPGGYGSQVEVDDNGITHLAGTFFQSMPPTKTTPKCTTKECTYIMRLDQLGKPVWSMTMGHFSPSKYLFRASLGFSLDAQGNYYIGSAFAGTHTFADSVFKCPSKIYCSLLAKVSPKGTVIWSKVVPWGSVGPFGGIAKAKGELCFAGSYSGTVTYGKTKLSCVGKSCVLVGMIDTHGDYVWVASAGASLSTASVHQVVTTPTGGCTVLGQYNGMFTAGASTLGSNSPSDLNLFLAHAEAGKFNWAAAMKLPTYWQYFPRLAVDAQGTSHVVVSLRPATGQATTGSLLLTRFSNKGKLIGSRTVSGDVDKLAMAADAQGNTVIAGETQDPSITLDGTTLKGGLHAFFVARVDKKFGFQWAVRAAGKFEDVAADRHGNSYLAGYFGYPSAFGPTKVTKYGHTHPSSLVWKLDADGK